MTGPKFEDTGKQVLTLLEAVKKDNLLQFGEIKKEFGGVDKTLQSHDTRISVLERDKIERDAIEVYKHENPKEAQATMNKDQNTVTIPKDLVTAAKYIAWAGAALIAAVLGLKMI